MTELWNAIASLVGELHPDWVEAFATELQGISSVSDFRRLEARMSSAPAVSVRLEKAWMASPDVSPLQLAAALRAAAATHDMLRQGASIDLVWTGPDTGLIPVRHTEQALLQVIREARNRLFIVSYVAFEIKSIQSSLLEAVGRGVQIRLLLELAKEHGGAISVDSVRIMRTALPTATIYVWRQGGGGRVHAKCAVADESIAFITSANLTGAALEKNMELGVVIRGGDLPKRLGAHLDALVATGAVSEWNA